MEKHNILTSYALSTLPSTDHYPMHTHNDCEILLFLDGDASYAVEGTVYKLKPGDIVLMRPAEAHHPILHSPANYERYVVNFDTALLRQFSLAGHLTSVFLDRPLGKYNHYRNTLFPDNHWRYYFSKMLEYNGQEQALYYLLPLLGELAEATKTIKLTTEDISPDKSEEIILYVNRHLFDDISLDTICQRFYLCKSQLNRIFKKTTGSTVWNYITVKRLLYARQRLQNGDAPTKIFEKCGFRDYASFYKAYRHYFGISPKEDRVKPVP